jgi:hypothetical protein
VKETYENISHQSPSCLLSGTNICVSCGKIISYFRKFYYTVKYIYRIKAVFNLRKILSLVSQITGRSNFSFKRLTGRRGDNKVKLGDFLEKLFVLKQNLVSHPLYSYPAQIV